MRNKPIAVFVLSLILAVSSACGANTALEAEITSDSNAAAVDTSDTSAVETAPSSAETAPSSAETESEVLISETESTEEVTEESITEAAEESQVSETTEESSIASTAPDEPIDENDRKAFWSAKVKAFAKSKLATKTITEYFNERIESYPPSEYATELRLDDFTFDNIPEIIFVQGGLDAYCSYYIFDLDGNLISRFPGTYSYDPVGFEGAFYSCTNITTNEPVIMYKDYRDFMGMEETRYVCIQDELVLSHGFDFYTDDYFAIFLKVVGFGGQYEDIDRVEGEEASNKVLNKFLNNYTEFVEYPLSGAAWRFTDEEIDCVDDELCESIAEKLTDEYLKFIGE